MMKDLSIKVPRIIESDGLLRLADHEVVMKPHASLWVNGHQILTVMTSPSRIEDFVTGYPYTGELLGLCATSNQFRSRNRQSGFSQKRKSRYVPGKNDPFRLRR